MTKGAKAIWTAVKIKKVRCFILFISLIYTIRMNAPIIAVIIKALSLFRIYTFNIFVKFNKTIFTFIGCLWDRLVTW